MSQHEKSEILSTMRSEREAWEDLLSKVDEARMIEPGVEGEWSVKDVIAHITFFERSMANRLEQAMRGEPATRAPLEVLELDESNHIIFEQNRFLTLEQVLRDSRDTFERIYDATSSLSEEDLNAHRLSGEKLDEPLWEQITGDTYEHYHQHIPPLRKWLGLDDQS